MKGEVDPRSGFVVDLKQLKEVMHREVLDAMDHRFLNKEVPEFFTHIPTTENMAIAVWQRLQSKLQKAQLHRVRVYETPDLFVDFYGEASQPKAKSQELAMKAHLTRRYLLRLAPATQRAMSAEENLATYGKCNNPHGHGHNYALEVTVSGQVDQRTGMVCNLVDLDGFVEKEVVSRYDLENFNMLQEFAETVPTTENLCVEIFEILHRRFSKSASGRSETRRNHDELLRIRGWRDLAAAALKTKPMKAKRNNMDP